MPPCKLVYKIEAQSHALSADTTRIFCPVEAFRQVGLLLRWNTYSCILDSEFYKIVRLPLYCDCDRSPLWTIADGIA